MTVDPCESRTGEGRVGRIVGDAVKVSEEVGDTCQRLGEKELHVELEAPWRPSGSRPC